MTPATKHNTNLKLRLAPSPADTRDQKFSVLRRRPNPYQDPRGWCWLPIAVCIDLDEAYGMLRAVGAILPASTKEDAAR